MGRQIFASLFGDSALRLPQRPTLFRGDNSFDLRVRVPVGCRIIWTPSFQTTSAPSGPESSWLRNASSYPNSVPQHGQNAEVSRRVSEPVISANWAKIHRVRLLSALVSEIFHRCPSITGRRFEDHRGCDRTCRSSGAVVGTQLKSVLL